MKSFHYQLFYNQSARDSVSNLQALTIVSKYNKTEVESVHFGISYIADMDKCPQKKCCLENCCGDSCNLVYMFPGRYV